jgi:NarL family two-component system response regulator YdfI
VDNNERRTIRLLLANRYPVIFEGVRAMLLGSADIDMVGYAASIPAMIRLVGELQPEVLIMDPYMCRQDGLQAIRLIRGEWPQVRIIVFAIQDDEEHLLRALRCGVSAYLTLCTERATLLQAIRAAARGETLLPAGYIERLLARTELAPHEHSPPLATPSDQELTGREQEVLQRVANGERNKEIAARLGISEPTVKSHLANIYFKLGVDSRASAVAVALERGLLPLQKRIKSQHT